MIQKEIYIEDLVNTVPGAVTYLMEHGIKCIACGEPVWGYVGIGGKREGVFGCGDRDIPERSHGPAESYQF